MSYPNRRVDVSARMLTGRILVGRFVLGQSRQSVYVGLLRRVTKRTATGATIELTNVASLVGQQ